MEPGNSFKKDGDITLPTAKSSIGRLKRAHGVLINKSLVTLVKPISEEGWC